MKAVILAAGESTRMHPLTLTWPKPLLTAANKPLLVHTMDALDGLVDDVILVVGYRADAIRAILGDRHRGIKISYVHQPERLGTGEALFRTREMLRDSFLVLMGDDLYCKEDLLACVDPDFSPPYRMLTSRSPHPERHGVLEVRGSMVTDLIEKPQEFVSDLINHGLYVLDEEIFPLLERLKPSERGEIELTEAVRSLIHRGLVGYREVSRWCLSVGYPWDLLAANQKLLDEVDEPLVEGSVETGAVLKGPVSVGKGSLIRSGSYLEGPVCIGKRSEIGPNCLVRPWTSVGDGCRIGHAVEIKNSILMDGTCVSHLSYVGDSVLGRKVNIGAGTMIANLRHDAKEVLSMIKGRLVSTDRLKFGAVLGDEARTGVGTLILPGRKLWPGTVTSPGEKVWKDLAS